MEARNNPIKGENIMNKSIEKILIVYAGKYGSTAEVAEAIGQELNQCGVVVDVRRAKDVSEISSYHAVIVGSPIYMGKWLSEVMKFMKENEEALSRVPVIYFTVCLELTRNFGEEYQGIPIYLDPELGHAPKVEGKLSFSEKGHQLSGYLGQVLKKAPTVKPVNAALFGGRYYHKEAKFFDKLLMKLIKSREGDFRNWEAIRSWAASLYPMLLQEKGD